MDAHFSVGFVEKGSLLNLAERRAVSPYCSI